MVMKTYFVVQTYQRKRGKLAQGNAFEVASEGHALRRIQSISGSIVGAIAFSQDVDAESDEYGESRILGKCGEVPPLQQEA